MPVRQVYAYTDREGNIYASRFAAEKAEFIAGMAKRFYGDSTVPPLDQTFTMAQLADDLDGLFKVITEARREDTRADIISPEDSVELKSPPSLAVVS